jgi:hypothetical protein
MIVIITFNFNYSSMYSHAVVILIKVIKMVATKYHIWLHDYVWTLVTRCLNQPHFGIMCKLCVIPFCTTLFGQSWGHPHFRGHSFIKRWCCLTYKVISSTIDKAQGTWNKHVKLLFKRFVIYKNNLNKYLNKKFGS